MKTNTAAKRILAFCSSLFLAIMIIGILPISGEEKIYDEVIRLHVIANSDSREDQALKLRVRDAVLDAAEEITRDCQRFGDALSLLSEDKSLDALTAAAKKVVLDSGYDYGVSITLAEERYPQKSYDSLCFPSGCYTSLRVLIGSAEGENWWCVLFPRLCIGAASSSADEEFAAAGFTPDQYKIVTDTDEPRYEVRFKILELIDAYFG